MTLNIQRVDKYERMQKGIPREIKTTTWVVSNYCYYFDIRGALSNVQPRRQRRAFSVTEIYSATCLEITKYESHRERVRLR
jgi:hypothetical protein